jgi:hypothetical protein
MDLEGIEADLQRLRLLNPMLHYTLKMIERGIAPKELAYAALIRELVQGVNGLIADNVRLLERQPAPPIILGR